MQNERFIPLGIQEISGKEYIGICVDENWIAEVMKDSFTGTFILCEGNTVCDWNTSKELIPYSYKGNSFAMDGTTLLQVAHAYHDSFLSRQIEKAEDLDTFDYDR